ncbi:hypothetical protein PMIN06_012617 [Paraphaeosphaeria minitans]|uniref:Epoxide hydrolase n=1 Tax=Paraphaeosphaeria minitans TaxID=565426 RepID=A0A9P6KVS4_9PLEO|nr:putative epoxide hydrolase [Paraphaeosphaeria minitans]
MSSPEPYKIHVPDASIEKLKRRLEDTNYPDELESDDQWRYGAPLSDVNRLAEHWRTGFDWRKIEAGINELPNYRKKVSVDGFGDIDLHFVWQKSEVEGAIPLLFSHGWPGSFLEVQKLLPLLKGDGDSPAFHIVARSLPNFGFSQRITKPGFALEQYAQTCHRLMLDLGYPNPRLAHQHDPRASFASQPVLALQHALTPYSDAEKKGLERSEWFTSEGQAYRQLQATKPQTLSYAFASSPVALLAWIYEKLVDWTDGYPWTDDEILTWVSIYYFSTAGPNAHVRISYEASHNPTAAVPSRERLSAWIGSVKLGLAHFPREITVVPRVWGKTLGDVVHESVNERGGHFAAWERPDVVSKDLMNMFGKKGPLYKIVPGKSGY